MEVAIAVREMPLNGGTLRFEYSYFLDYGEYELCTYQRIEGTLYTSQSVPSIAFYAMLYAYKLQNSVTMDCMVL